MRGKREKVIYNEERFGRRRTRGASEERKLPFRGAVYDRYETAAPVSAGSNRLDVDKPTKTTDLKFEFLPANGGKAGTTRMTVGTRVKTPLVQTDRLPLPTAMAPPFRFQVKRSHRASAHSSSCTPPNLALPTPSGHPRIRLPPPATARRDPPARQAASMRPCPATLQT